MSDTGNVKYVTKPTMKQAVKAINTAMGRCSKNLAIGLFDYFDRCRVSQVHIARNNHFRSFDGSYSEYVTQREIERLTEQRDYDWKVREIHRLEQVVEQQRVWKRKKN